MTVVLYTTDILVSYQAVKREKNIKLKENPNF